MRILLILLLCVSIAQAQTITVDVNQSFQTMRGWEAHEQSGELDFPAGFAVYSSSLFDQVVEMGINRVRLEFRGDVENTGAPFQKFAVNDNADPNSYNAAGFNWSWMDTSAQKVVLPLKTRLAAQGESLYINLCYVDFMNSGSFFHANSPSEYAELALAAFQRLDNMWGIVPDALEIILEPNWSPTTNDTRWTAAKVSANLIAAQARLAAAGYNPRFIVPSTVRCTDAATWYANMKTANSSVTQYIDEVSMHWYTPCSDGELNTLRNAVQADGNSLSMLEWWDATNNYTYVHNLIGPNGNGTSWEPTIIAYPDPNPTDGATGGYFLIDSDTNVITMSPRSKFYRQYFKWIRYGAVRKGSSTSNSNFDGLAFRNVSGNYTVVVKAATSGSFQIAGLPAGTYHIRYTTSSVYNQNPGDQVLSGGQNISTSIPAAGVLTVFADEPSAPGSTARGRVTVSGRVTIKE